MVKLGSIATGSLDDYDLWLLEAAAQGQFSIEQLSKMGRVPKSTAYRRVPVLVDRGMLNSERRDSGVGRPALVYTITDAGLDELKSIAKTLRETVDRLCQTIATCA